MDNFDFPDANGEMVKTEPCSSRSLNFNQPTTNTVEHVRGGYTVLLGGLSSLVEDLKTSSISQHHLNLALQTREEVANIVENAESLSEQDFAGQKFNKRLGQHLKWYDKEVIAPLSKVVDWDPDDAAAHELEQGEKRETQGKCEDRTWKQMRNNLPKWIREIETCRDQLLATFCRGKLSILLRKEKVNRADRLGYGGLLRRHRIRQMVHGILKSCPNKTLWRGEALETGGVGQGDTLEKAVEATINAAEQKCIEARESQFKLHLPGPVEEFIEFEQAGENRNRFEAEDRGSFSKVVARDELQKMEEK